MKVFSIKCGIWLELSSKTYHSLLLLSLSSLFKKCDIEKKWGKFCLIKNWGKFYKILHPWYLATPLWPWCKPWGKEAKTKSEGSRVQIQVSPDICVLSTTMNNYQAASPGGTYCKRYLPWFITSTWAKKGGQKRNLRISLKQPVVGRLISIMANQKVNERGVSIWRQKLGSILIYWSCLTEKRSWNPPP